MPTTIKELVKKKQRDSLISLSENAGKLIFQARKNKKMSRTSLGEKVKLHETTIKKYEDGKIKNAKISVIKAFSEALDIEFESLTSLNDYVKFFKKTFPKIKVYEYVVIGPPISREEYRERQKQITETFDFNNDDFLEPHDRKEMSFAFKNVIDEISNPYHHQQPSTGAQMLHGLRVSDDSINKCYAVEGMYAIVDPHSHTYNGDIGVFIIDDGPAIIREFFKLDNFTICLAPRSYNTNHEKLIFSGPEEYKRVSRVGKVIGFVSPSSIRNEEQTRAWAELQRQVEKKSWEEFKQKRNEEYT